MEQRIEYKLTVLAYRCLHDLASAYLTNELQLVSSLDTRRRLRSPTTNPLVVPPTHLSTVGDRAFPVAAARVRNNLPVSVTSAATLNMFKQWLKTELYICCYDLPFCCSMQTFHIILSYCFTTRFTFTFLLVRCPSSLWTQCHATIISTSRHVAPLRNGLSVTSQQQQFRL